MEDVNRWLPKKTVEAAYERGVITRGDLEFYNRVWGRTKLSTQHSNNKARINKLILSSQKPG